FFPRAEQELLKREYHSIRQTSTETSTEFMQRFLRLAGFLGAAAGTEEEQAKNFQWGLRRSTLNHLMCMSYTDVAQVANAAHNYENLHERDDEDTERPDKRVVIGINRPLNRVVTGATIKITTVMDLTGEMVNTRTETDLSAAVQNALQALLPQIRKEIHEEFRTGSGSSNASSSGLPRFFRGALHQTPPITPSVISSKNINQAEPHAKNDEVADDEFINIFSTPVQDQGETSTRHVDSSNMHTFYQRYPSEQRWTKDHPLEQVIGNPLQSVRTRRHLESDAEMCMFALT
nr:zinc finger, CCHC-type, retrotransposon Gag domain protein [Tanacetum cinerariifolium]